MKIARYLALGLVLLGIAVGCTSSAQDVNDGKENNENGQLVPGRPEVTDKPEWWDKGQEQFPFEGLAFLPDSKQLLTGCKYGLILWDLETGKVIRVLEKTERGGSGILSADGKWVLASAGGLGLWEVATGKQVSNLSKMHSQKSIEPSVSLLNLSPDGQHALIGCIRSLEHPKHPTPDMLLGILQLWDTKKGEMLLNLEGHRGRIYSAALSFNGKLALSQSHDVDDFITLAGKRTIKIWDLEKGKVIRSFGSEDQNGEIFFSTDDKLIYSVGSKVRSWDVATGNQIQLFTTEGRGYPLAFSRDLGYYITRLDRRNLPKDGSLILWELSSGKEMKMLERKNDERQIDSVRFSPNGKLVAVGGDFQILEIWDLETGKKARDLTLPHDILYPPGPFRGP